MQIISNEEALISISWTHDEYLSLSFPLNFWFMSGWLSVAWLWHLAHYYKIKLLFSLGLYSLANVSNMKTLARVWRALAFEHGLKWEITCEHVLVEWNITHVLVNSNLAHVLVDVNSKFRKGVITCGIFQFHSNTLTWTTVKPPHVT